MYFILDERHTHSYFSYVLEYVCRAWAENIAHTHISSGGAKGGGDDSWKIYDSDNISRVLQKKRRCSQLRVCVPAFSRGKKKTRRELYDVAGGIEAKVEWQISIKI